MSGRVRAAQQEADLKAQQEAEAKAKAKADAEERKRKEREADKARADEVAGSFELGQSSKQAMSGMGDLLAAQGQGDAKAQADSGPFGPIFTQFYHDAQGAIATVRDHSLAIKFPLDEAIGSYSGISHNGNARGKADEGEYQEYIENARRDALEVATTDAQKSVVDAAVDELRADYIKQYKRLATVRASTYSGYVAGRGKLNTKQAENRNNAYSKAIDTFVAWQKENKKRLRKLALDARTDEQKEADRAAAQAAIAEKERRAKDADLNVIRKILSWKKGGDPVALGKASHIAGVVIGKDGYPVSIKLAPTDGSKLIDDKFDVAMLLRKQGMSVPESKRLVRELVDAVRAEDAPDNPETFIQSPDGTLDFGEITPEMAKAAGRQAGKIRLQRGVQNADGTGYGLAHIEANHGEQIRRLGFDSVEAFIQNVAGGFSEIWRAKGGQLLVTLNDGRKNVMFVRLSSDPDGDFYRVNSAFPVRQKDYEARKGMEKLWDGSEPTSAATGRQPAFAAGNPDDVSSEASPNARNQSTDSITQPGAAFTQAQQQREGKTSSAKQTATKIEDAGEKLAASTQLPRILKLPRKKYLDEQIKKISAKEGTPAYDKAVQSLRDDYDTERDRAYAGLTFEQFDALNNDSPEGVNRQAWEADQLTAADIAAVARANAKHLTNTGSNTSTQGRLKRSTAEDAELAQAQRQFAEAERAYGWREAYDKAKAAGKTKLNYGQWVQVRTPNFKAWFGDWEIAASVPERAASTFAEAREQAKAFQGNPLTNGATGIVATVSRNNLDKMLSSKAVGKSESPAAHSLAVANLDALFERAVLGWSKPDAENDPNIRAIHRFFAPVRVGGKAMLAKMTVKETHQESKSNPLYTVEAVGFEEIKSPAAQWVGEIANADGIDPRTIRSAGLVQSMAQRVQDFNPANVSKAIDPHTGEPLVVYHGTGGDIATFEHMVWGSESQELANDYAEMRGEFHNGNANVMPLFIRATTPLDAEAQALQDGPTVSQFVKELVRQREYRSGPLTGSQLEDIARLSSIIRSAGMREESGPRYFPKDFWNDARATFGQDGAEAIRDLFAMLGFDSVEMIERGTRTIGVFDAERAKSAIGNRGTFDPSNSDIRYSRSSATQQAYEQRIDALFAGDSSRAKGIRILERSDVLDVLGFGDKPLHLQESAVGKLDKNTGQVKHPGMTAQMWKRVPEWIENPVAVFRSQTVPDALVMFAPELVNGRPVRITIEPSKGMAGMDVHVTTNAYEESGSAVTPVDKWANDAKALLYLDQKESPAFSERSGLRLPSEVRQLRGYKHKVQTEADLAKYRQAQNSRYRQGQAIQGSKSVPLRLQLDRLIRGWKNAPAIKVVQSIKNLPDALRAQVERDGAFDVEGMYLDGKVYLVADNLRDATHAAFVLQHEVLGHAGLQGVYGQRLNPMLAGIYSSHAQVKDQANALMGRYGYSKEVAVEEVLADMAADGSLREQSFWPRLVAAIRAALRDLGINVAFSDADIEAMLGNARRYITQQGRPSMRTTGGQVRYREGGAAQEMEIAELDEADFIQSLADPSLARSFASAMYRTKGTDSTFFKRWFGNSRMVDKSGKPMTFVHRSFGEKDTFDDARLGGNTGTVTAALGHYLARTDVGNVERYGPVTERFYVRMEKPKVITQDQFAAMGEWGSEQVKSFRKTLMSQGYDGIYIQGLAWPVVFEGKNIKAVRNIGTFDESNRVRYSREGQRDEDASEQSKALRELAQAASAPGNVNTTVMLGALTAEQSAFLQAEGLDVLEGYSHTADMFAVRHALNRHGDAKVEAKQGQLPIGEADIAAISQVVGEADALILGAKTPRGQDIVGSLKRMPDGTVLYLEEVRSGRKALAMTSMRKYPGTTDFETIKNRIVPSYAQSDTGDVRIVYPDAEKRQNEDSGLRYSRSGQRDEVLTGPAASAFDDFVYNLQDKHIDTKRIVQAIKKAAGGISDAMDTYLQETLFHGRAAKRVQDFVRLEMGALTQAMQENGISKEALEEYLHARHAKEANKLLAQRNPNQEMIDEGLEQAYERVAEANAALEADPKNKEVKAELKDALIELKKWRTAQPFKGTDAERLSLSGMSDQEADAVLASLSKDQLQRMDRACRVGWRAHTVIARLLGEAVKCLPQSY